MLVAKVVLRNALLSFDALYSYAVPVADQMKIKPGSRVMVPFGTNNRKEEAFVIRLDNAEGTSFVLKEIVRSLDEQPLFSSEQLKLAGMMTRRYACTWGAALRLMLPAAVSMHIDYYLTLTATGLQELSELKINSAENEQNFLSLATYLSGKRNYSAPLKLLQKQFDFLEAELSTWIEAGYILRHERINSGMKDKTETVRTVYLTDRDAIIALIESDQISSLNQLRVLQLLLEYGEISEADCMAVCSVTKVVLNGMIKKKWLAVGTACYERKRSDVLSAVSDSANAVSNSKVSQAGLEGETFIEEDTPGPVLTQEQNAVLQTLQFELLKRPVSSPASSSPLKENLLFGITGSGKTEVYLRLTAIALQQNLGVIILVPEIALTPQMTYRFQKRFGSNIAVLHSRLTPRQKFEQWRRLASGEAKIAVGARSAIFAPVVNLGLIIIDEEQESSYRADTHPRYDARTLARYRCHNTGAMLLLGSATPSMEAFHRTATGKSGLLELRNRPGMAVLPDVQIVDMRQENRHGNFTIYSDALINACTDACARGEQVMILLNRRGFASSYMCYSCGQVRQCPNCSVNLTYHQQGRRLICHYCGHIESATKTCPQCGSSLIGGVGYGTQQAESVLQEMLPQAKILRMDQDTTATRLSHGEILTSFRRHEADILIGTQMIAKGHDFPNVTVVGIIGAEKAFFTGDFRASERAFQLFTQAAGRAGRSQKKGKVFLQTYNPDEYAVTCAVNQDYRSFYAAELPYRQALCYPPCGAVLTLQASAPIEITVEHFFRFLYRDLNERFVENRMNNENLIVHKPARSPVWRLNNRVYWQMFLISDKLECLAKIMLYVAQLKLKNEVRLSWNLDG